MVYITVHQRPKYKQITLDELLSNEDFSSKPIAGSGFSDTITYEREFPSAKFLSCINVPDLIKKLEDFNANTATLHQVERESLYREYMIPKATEGMRRISEPLPQLKLALYQLMYIFQNDFHTLHHTSAYAYIQKRSVYDAVRKHQSNESWWFGSFDFKDFFGSTTLDFVMRMFSMVFPFSEVVRSEKGKTELETALSLCFLRGGLPQGSPISPLITNVMMIPIDFALNRDFQNFGKQSFVYTRYADDIDVSSRYTFDIRKIEAHINEVLMHFGAPFHIKPEKTHYGSRAGKNFMLGLMLNKDNVITVGSKKKRALEATLSAYAMDKKAGRLWPVDELQHINGNLSYYRHIEGETIDRIVAHLSKRFGIDIEQMIKNDMALSA